MVVVIISINRCLTPHSKNILIISWLPILLVEEAGLHRKVVWSIHLAISGSRTHKLGVLVGGTRIIGRYNNNYHTITTANVEVKVAVLSQHLQFTLNSPIYNILW
jgi:hypothetical protein